MLELIRCQQMLDIHLKISQLDGLAPADFTLPNRRHDRTAIIPRLRTPPPDPSEFEQTDEPNDTVWKTGPDDAISRCYVGHMQRKAHISAR
jgi:hypothetical protein